MLEPYRGRIFDPCCGSGGMFVQSEKFVQAHGGRIGDVSVFGQESNQTTWRLCKMNIAIRGIDARIEWGDSFRDDQFKDLKADFILANPPFNDSDWGGELLQDDARWKFGIPPRTNANFAWVQHFIHHLSPTGMTGFVLANSSMSSNTSNEREIRKNIIEADLVDCMVALPSQLFYNTGIPACLWFISRDKRNQKFRDRSGEVLFIDARNLGMMVDRRHRELNDEVVKKISETYHAWRGEQKDKKYQDIPGFCRSTSLEELRKHNWILTPGRFVGTEEVEGDEELFEAKMKELASQLSKQVHEGKRLDEEIIRNLEHLGYGE
jgi:type I restriction enzyme M protein